MSEFGWFLATIVVPVLSPFSTEYLSGGIEQLARFGQKAS